jgi:hypothetical protein
VQDAFPGWHGCNTLPVCPNLIPVQLTATGVDVYLCSTQPTFTLPDESSNPERDDDGESKVCLEETLSIIETVFAGRRDRGIELCSPQVNFTDSYIHIFCWEESQVFSLPERLGRAQLK